MTRSRSISNTFESDSDLHKFLSDVSVALIVTDRVRKYQHDALHKFADQHCLLV